MAIRVDFNTPIGGTTGRTDIMRVLAATGSVADDFDARVIFSSNYLSAQMEEFTATVSTVTAGTTSSASGSFTLGRKYKTYPLVFACYQQTDGKIIWPYFFNQFHSAASPQGNGNNVYTLERQENFSVDAISLGSNGFRLDWIVYNYGAGGALTNGTVRVRVIGQGI